MTRVDVGAILAELKGFQRDAVEHAMSRLYEAPDAGRRFLIADETGLGKSVVARGIIARVIERLESEPSIERIDIVYVCSNADLAQQNLQRLNVTGNRHLAMTGRLTLLALQSRRLAGVRVDTKVVNLVSFTPGTSFEMGSWRTGTSEERALLHVMLCDALKLSESRARASRLIFKGPVRKMSSFEWQIAKVRRQLSGPVHEPIMRSFVSGATERGLIAAYAGQLDSLAGRRKIGADQTQAVRQLTAELRSELARASVETLEPDLVILDEFQRFRHLLDPENGGEAAELAHHLFDYKAAKVLLLSATPYKAYTSSRTDAEEDHYSDFMTTLEFLAQGSTTKLTEVKRLFAGYREGLINGRPVDAEASALRQILLTLMSRSERPAADDMTSERQITSDAPPAGDLVEYATLQQLSEELDVAMSLEYWKSVPQFGNFMDGYEIGRALDRKLAGNEASLRPILSKLGSLSNDAIRTYSEVDGRNASLRILERELLDSGMWRILWLPPSMPYLAPGGAFTGLSSGTATKRLIFSSWTATPTAIASLLSYGAERRMVAGSRLTENTSDARKSVASRLDWNMEGDRAAAMSTLALFWPHPGLAQIGDPLLAARTHPTRLVSSERAEAAARSAIGARGPVADQPWKALLSQADALPHGLDQVSAAASLGARGFASLDEDGSDETVSRGLEAHVANAFDFIQTTPGLRPPALASLALHSPGNIAYRALGRLRDSADETTDAGHWNAAAQLSNGLRTLFNRLESTLLLDQLYGTTDPYWQVILRYCADGNLQATLDEYLFQLRSESAGTALDDDQLLRIAERAYGAMTMRPSIYRARDLSTADANIPFTGRFALRYGGKQQDQESARQPEIRNAFNSPFWPFVLASTSVGQEGIDFHWWSHAVVHWNLPSNPVDFEQREGRVNRFAGHAVRKNVAAAHRSEVLVSGDPNPWRAAFEAASSTHPELGEFAPYWMYPGAAKVERQIITYPLSRDIERAARLKDALTLYRLTLGQPRQQDMMEMMIRRGVDGESVAKLDLSPPKRSLPTARGEHSDAPS
ncbi:MAG: helicase-related protein [Pseudolysinimonas sp.]